MNTSIAIAILLLGFNSVHLTS